MRLTDQTGVVPKSVERISAANPFAGGANVQNNDPSGMNLFEAMEKQLGLKLEQTKRPGKVMVIDHLEEKPNQQ